jgi:hypothetical protein
MTTMLQQSRFPESGLGQGSESRTATGWQSTQRASPAPTVTVASVPLSDRQSVVEIVLAAALGLVSCVVQFVLYAAMMLAFPMMPFVLPLLIVLPVVLAFGFLILIFGAILAALGWL